MLIKQKSIRSARRFLRALSLTKSVRLVFNVSSDKEELLSNAGFGAEIKSGDTILPSAIGKVSNFNAEGRYDLLKDLPKEPRYITTIEWSWEQWSGYGQTETKTEYRDIYRDCYQREFVSPPSIELTYIEVDGHAYICSPELDVGSIKPKELKHLINLFLELFGECEIRKADLSSFLPPKIKRLNWELLPPGKYPWSKIRQHVRKLVKDKHTRYSSVILERQEKITSYQPDEAFIGLGGFRAYIAYVFKEKNIVVLESVLTGNATYVFGENWKDFAMLTKAEILNNNFQKDRLIHSKGWENRLRATLKNSHKKAA